MSDSARLNASEGAAIDAITDKIDRLDRLQASEEAARRHSVRVAWLSVGSAALVLAGLLAIVGTKVADKQAQLTQVTGELDKQNARLERVKSDLVTKGQELVDTDRKLAALHQQVDAYQVLLAQLKPSKEQLETAVGTAPPGAAAPAQLLPRAYVQIVEAADREWAAKVAVALRHDGTLVPGIELVTKAGVRDVVLR